MNAELSILGDSPSPRVPVSIVSSDDSRLKITKAPPLQLGAPVKVHYDDFLWLGEVVECHPDGAAVIQVLHCLNNLAELSRLADRFTGRITPKELAQPQPEPTLS
jgi:hypothetical protein